MAETNCVRCGGEGFMNWAADEMCQDCNGTGRVKEPAAAPTPVEPDPMDRLAATLVSLKRREARIAADEADHLESLLLPAAPAESQGVERAQPVEPAQCPKCKTWHDSADSVSYCLCNAPDDYRVTVDASYLKSLLRRPAAQPVEGPMDVHCPKCAAHPGTPCLPFSGTNAPPPMKGFHKERIAAAQPVEGPRERKDWGTCFREWWDSADHRNASVLEIFKAGFEASRG